LRFFLPDNFDLGIAIKYYAVALRVSREARAEFFVTLPAEQEPSANRKFTETRLLHQDLSV
jgi:hypothetical protein